MKFCVIYQQTSHNAHSPVRVIEQTTGQGVGWINRYLDREYVRRLANTTLCTYAYNLLHFVRWWESFPPRPQTHHVRWIEADVSVADRVFVAIEAGALVRTFDGGRIWRDRVRGGPYDTHTAMTHPFAPGRIYSAAGDGYYERTDAGRWWRIGRASCRAGGYE